MCGTIHTWKNIPLKTQKKELFKKKLFKPGGEITFAGGEPTILKEFDELINFLLKNGASRITVHSSGIKHSKAIEKGIKQGVLSVCLSADSGTRETYKKVKRVDKFEQFWKTAKKYAEAQQNGEIKFVETKFILIPEVNTTFSGLSKPKSSHNFSLVSRITSATE